MNATPPRHVAIIMDGNGRWAKQRHLPRVAGHKAGVDVVKKIVRACVERKVEVLTLFAFSSENWRRPREEVSYLMDLFIGALEREAHKLHEQNVVLRIIGDRSRFSDKLQTSMQTAEQLTAANTGLKLVVAANYGGQWDICQAVQKLLAEGDQQQLATDGISPDVLQKYLSMADLPDPDLLIRTSGEQRISNFLLWQLAYTELYFSEALWPDFSPEELDKAFQFYQQRERRFGCTSEQLRPDQYA